MLMPGGGTLSRAWPVRWKLLRTPPTFLLCAAERNVDVTRSPLIPEGWKAARRLWRLTSLLHADLSVGADILCAGRNGGVACFV
jgi:hypothetical protein